jgi:hypothetical protein
VTENNQHENFADAVAEEAAEVAASSTEENPSPAIHGKLKQKGLDIVPTREERLGTIIAYGGSCQGLLKGCGRKCRKHQERSFSQSGPCDEMMPLLNSAMINGNVIIAHSPAGCPSMIDAVYLLNNCTFQLFSRFIIFFC